MLCEHGVQAEGFLDRNADSCSLADAPIYFPTDVDDKRDVTVVVGIVLNLKTRLAVEQYLKSLGYDSIIDGQSIRAHYVYALEEKGEKNPQNYFYAKISMITEAVSLFADEESRLTFECNLAAHIQRSYTKCMQTKQEQQYFLSDIPFAKGFARFVDCGAYVGDTLELLIKHTGGVEAVVAFEPSRENFNKLSANYDEHLQPYISQGVLFPCGVDEGMSMRKFTFAGGSSAVSENGCEIVQCVNLDAVLKNFMPTFIKMDIEGAEYGALCGAKKLISRYRPDLAVCVYHIIDDFWRIPLLINSWHLGYRFYLRAHSSCCMETVLYAVCPEGVESVVGND